MRKEYIYLNRLRETGATNMFGAAPYLEKAFHLDSREARKVLMEWMQWANENPSNLDK